MKSVIDLDLRHKSKAEIIVAMEYAAWINRLLSNMRQLYILS